MLKTHLEAYDNAGLILEGYFYELNEFINILKTYKWLKGKEIHIVDTTENEIAAIITL